jgi:cytochrome oxidase Cu insertion factor (SCO1/SenC/PrrC family)
MNAAHATEGTGTPRRRARRPTGVAVLAGVAIGLAPMLLAIAFETRRDLGAAPTPVALAAEATWPPGARPGPAFSLRNQEGSTVSISSMRGRVVLLTFLDSRCEHLCRIEGPLLGDVQQRLPRATRPVIVVVSVNPEDSAASVRAAARRWGWQPNGWQWLMGSRRQLAAVWQAYGVDVQPAPDDILHTGALYVIDRAGDERAGFATPFDVERVIRVISSIDGTAS